MRSQQQAARCTRRCTGSSGVTPHSGAQAHGEIHPERQAAGCERQPEPSNIGLHHCQPEWSQSVYHLVLGNIEREHQTLKIRMLLEDHYLPGQLEEAPPSSSTTTTAVPT